MQAAQYPHGLVPWAPEEVVVGGRLFGQQRLDGGALALDVPLELARERRQEVAVRIAGALLAELLGQLCGLRQAGGIATLREVQQLGLDPLGDLGNGDLGHQNAHVGRKLGGIAPGPRGRLGGGVRVLRRLEIGLG